MTYSVQSMDVLLLSTANNLLALLGTMANLKLSCLIICAVGARNKLLVLLLEGEPRFQIVLLGSSVVQRTCDDANNLVGEAERLVELLRVGHHLVELVPAVIGTTENKLLYLLELVHTEHTPSVATVAASLLSEASAVTTVLDRKLGGLNPLLSVEGGKGLLAGSNQVSVRLRRCRAFRDTVQLLVELRELSSLGHLVAVEHERGLVRGVAYAQNC